MCGRLGSEWLYSRGRKTLSYENIYKDINFKDKILQELANSKNCLNVLKQKGVLLKKNLRTSQLNLKRPQI